MAKTLKRILALLLVAVMAMSTIGMTNIADTAKNGSGGDIDVTKPAKPATAAVVSPGEASVVAQDYDGKVSVEKTIKKVDGSDTDFDITLKVVAKTEEIQQSISNPLAVCIVLDLSSSMNYIFGDTTRIKAAKQAAQSFVNTLDKNCYVSVATFGEWGSKMIDWTQLSDEGRAGINNSIGAITIPDAHGTNMQDGLKKASEYLTSNAISFIPEENRVTVLISDGQPTYYVKENGERGGEGWRSSKTICDYTLAQAEKLQGEKYAVYIGKLDDACYYTETRDLPTSYIRSNANDYDVKLDVCKAYFNWNESNFPSELTSEQYEDVKNNHVWTPNYSNQYYTTCHKCNQGKDGHSVFYFKKRDAQTETVYYPGVPDKGVNVSKFDKYTVNDLLTAITGDSEKVLGAEDTEALIEKLNSIASTIETSHSGHDGSGWTVTDSLGRFIDYKALIDGVSKYISPDRNVVWNLSEATPEISTNGSTTIKTYTYTTTYRVTLNTTAPGFEDGEDYTISDPEKPTVLTKPEDDSVITVAEFNNPTVEGTAPEYYYTLNVYKETDDGYVLAHTEISQARVNTVIEGPANEEILNKAKLDNYHVVTRGEQITILPKGENVINFYCDRDPASVTVKHHYKAYGWEANGKYTGEDEAEENVISATYPGENDAKLYVGDDYTANKQTNFAGNDYNFKTGDDTIELQPENNEINLYYAREYDLREPATLVVNHYFKTNTYELVDGKYVLKEGEVSDPVLAQDLHGDEVRATQTHDIALNPGESSGFTGENRVEVKVNGETDNDATSITLQPGANTVDVYFVREVDNRKPATVTVKHNYVTNAHVINGDGQLVPAEPTTVSETDEPINAYVDETVAITEAANGFTPDESNSAKLSHEVKTAADTVELFYSKDTYPETSSVTVKHVYIDYTKETVTLYNDEGEAVGSDTATKEERSEPYEVVYGNDPVLYAGQKVIVNKITAHNGEEYTFSAEKSDDISDVRANGQTITLYYERTTELGDNRTETEWELTHNYYKNETRIKDGKIVTDEKIAEGQTAIAPVKGKIGDTVTLEPVTSYNGAEDYTLTTESLTHTLQKEGNSFELDYIRDVNSLGEPIVPSVTYEYYVKTMTVKNGVADYYGDWEKVETEEPVVGTYKADVENGEGYAELYAGQAITVASGKTDEYSEEISEIGLNQIVTENNKDFTYKYGKYVPLEKGKLTVKYNYKRTDIAANGDATVTETTGDDHVIADKYIGEAATAPSVTNGYKLVKVVIDGTTQPKAEEVTVPVGENTVVEYFYELTVDNSVPTSYTIDYVYEVYDYDVNGNSFLDENESHTVEGTKKDSYAGLTVPVNVRDEADGYDFIDITFNDQSIKSGETNEYAPVLDKGENKIVITYRTQKDSRDYNTEVNIYHVYYRHDTYNGSVVADGNNEADYIEHITLTGKDNKGIWVGGSFSFTEGLKKPNRNGYNYKFENVSPETINPLVGYADFSTQSFEETLGNDCINVFIAKYVRTDSSKDITVNHNYYEVGDITGERTPVGTYVDERDYLDNIVAGQSFTVEPIVRYGENDYNCETDPLSFTAEEGKQVINIDYVRVVHETIPANASATHKYIVIKPDGSEVLEGSTTTPYSGNVGDKINVEPEEKYNEISYKRLTPDEKLSFTLGKDADPTVEYVRYEYSVSYDSKGGSEVPSETVKEGEKAIKPADPTREGFDFDGWYLGDEKYDFDTPVIGNITLEAKWTEKPAVPHEYVVSYDSKGGSEVPAETVKEGEKATKPADPTREGFDFDGWYLDGEKYDFATPVTSDITLEAKWTEKPAVPHEYVVSYDSKGGSDVPAETVKEGEKATKPADPTRSGYDFDGWYLGGEKYDFSTPVTADITLEAKWTEKPATPVTPVYPYPSYPVVVPGVPTPAPTQDAQVELPDAGVPLAEAPETPTADTVSDGVELGDGDVPLAAAPSVEDEEELDEDLVPLGEAPSTGDSGHIILYAIIMLACAAGLIVIALTSRKKKNDARR